MRSLCPAVVVLGALLLAACSGSRPTAVAPIAPAAPQPGSTVVLLSDSDGSVGRVTVANVVGTTTLDQERMATRVADVRTAPSPAAPLTEAEIRTLFGAALAAQPPAPLHFTLYFEQGTTELTATSRGEFPAIVAAIRERGSADTSVVGHSDTAGDAQRNRELSLRRAEAVGRLLAADGVDPGALEITSHGEANPLVATGDNVSEPRNRRVEVTVR